MKSKPKILMIGTTDCVGGAARLSWNLSKELIKRGYSVKFLVGYKKSNKNNVYELKKPKLLKILDRATKLNITGIIRHAKSYIFANNLKFGSDKEMLSHPWYKNADIIHFHNTHGNYINLKILPRISKEKKLVWTFHDMWPITSHCAYTTKANSSKHNPLDCKLNSYPPILWDNRFRLWNKKKQFYKNSKFTIITPSNWLANKAKQTILKKNQIETISNGVDTNTFKPINKTKARKKLDFPINKKIILFVAQGGKLDSRKGWTYAMNAFNGLETKDKLLLCIGGGSKDKSNHLIKYIPYINNRKELNLYYNAADTLIFTSLSENCPLVILEALSTGLSVVSFKVGGIPELIKHKKNGYIAKIKSEKNLLKGLKWVLSNDLTEFKKINRKKAISQFSIENMGNKYINLYEKIK